jgi:hypothetical protein
MFDTRDFRPTCDGGAIRTDGLVDAFENEKVTGNRQRIRRQIQTALSIHLSITDSNVFKGMASRSDAKTRLAMLRQFLQINRSSVRVSTAGYTAMIIPILHENPRILQIG